MDGLLFAVLLRFRPSRVFRDPHRLHLHPLALSILNARHEAAGKPKAGLVFLAPRSGKPVDTFTDLKLIPKKLTVAEARWNTA